MKYFKLIVLMIMIMIGALNAETAFDINTTGVSAMDIGLGGVHTSSGSAHAVFTNSALLSHDINWSVDLFNTKTIDDVSIQNLSISKQFNQFSLAIGYAQTGMSDIPRTNLVSDVDDSDVYNRIIASDQVYSYKHSAIFTGARYMLNQAVAVGLTLKRLKTNLDTISGTGVNMDMGIIFKKTDYMLGLGIHNIATFQKMNYSGPENQSYQSEPFPTKLFVMGSRQINIKKIQTRIHTQLNKYQSNPLLFSSGIHLKYQNMPFIEGLIGIRTMPHLNKHITRKAIGLNLNVTGVTFSYAYEKSGTEFYNNRHYFSLSIYNKSSNKKNKEDKKIKSNKRSREEKRKPLQQSMSERELDKQKNSPKQLEKQLNQNETEIIQTEPVLIINLDSPLIITKTQHKLGISGTAQHIKVVKINGESIRVRPDNKFYKKINLPKDQEFSIKVTAETGVNDEITQIIKVIRK